jgi:hypothetical protein
MIQTLDKNICECKFLATFVHSTLTVRLTKSQTLMNVRKNIIYKSLAILYKSSAPRGTTCASLQYNKFYRKLIFWHTSK